MMTDPTVLPLKLICIHIRPDLTATAVEKDRLTTDNETNGLQNYRIRGTEIRPKGILYSFRGVLYGSPLGHGPCKK